MRRFFVLLFALVSISSLASNVLFYNTYEDYKLKRGEVKGEYQKLTLLNLKTTLKVNVGGETIKYKTEDLEKIWAFEAGGLLYRVYNEQLYEVVYINNDVFVYESAFLRMLVKKDDYVPGQDKVGAVYFSIGSGGYLEGFYEKKGIVSEYLVEKYPKLSKQFNCINAKAYMYNKKFYYTGVMKCFAGVE